MIAFDFGSLDNTGEGPVMPVNRQLPLERAEWDSTLPLVWDGGDGYYITRQEDRRACAFRCHYPEGSSPCSESVALDFAIWVNLTPPEMRRLTLLRS